MWDWFQSAEVQHEVRLGKGSLGKRERDADQPVKGLGMLGLERWFSTLLKGANANTTFNVKCSLPEENWPFVCLFV